METRFLGSRKAKLWTYLFLALLLIIGILVANLALVNPEAAREGVDFVAGLPNWAFPVIAFAVGSFFYWIGLKVETDWPEFFGAFLIAGALAAAELMLGWKHFELGGIVVLPYVFPVALFVVLLIVGMVKSK